MVKVKAQGAPKISESDGAYSKLSRRLIFSILSSGT